MTEQMKCCKNGCFQVKPISEFTRHPRMPDGLASQCKACLLDKAHYRKHGMTIAEKNRLAEQQGGCAICRRTEPSSKGWVIDHDHSCCPSDRSCAKCRRGILCSWCNTALGFVNDSPDVLRRMADYLESGHSLTDRVELLGGPMGGPMTRTRQDELT